MKSKLSRRVVLAAGVAAISRPVLPAEDDEYMQPCFVLPPGMAPAGSEAAQAEFEAWKGCHATLGRMDDG